MSTISKTAGTGDHVIEVDNEGTDTLDFSQVSGDLNVEIQANVYGETFKPAAFTVTSPADGSRVERDNNVPVQFVENITGGTGYNIYQGKRQLVWPAEDRRLGQRTVQRGTEPF